MKVPALNIPLFHGTCLFFFLPSQKWGPPKHGKRHSFVCVLVLHKQVWCRGGWNWNILVCWPSRMGMLAWEHKHPFPWNPQGVPDILFSCKQTCPGHAGSENKQHVNPTSAGKRSLLAFFCYCSFSSKSRALPMAWRFWNVQMTFFFGGGEWWRDAQQSLLKKQQQKSNLEKGPDPVKQAAVLAKWGSRFHLIQALSSTPAFIPMFSVENFGPSPKSWTTWTACSVSCSLMEPWWKQPHFCIKITERKSF